MMPKSSFCAERLLAILQSQIGLLDQIALQAERQLAAIRTGDDQELSAATAQREKIFRKIVSMGSNMQPYMRTWRAEGETWSEAMRAEIATAFEAYQNLLRGQVERDETILKAAEPAMLDTREKLIAVRRGHQAAMAYVKPPRAGRPRFQNRLG